MASNIPLSGRNHGVNSAATISLQGNHVPPNGFARHRTRNVLRSVMPGAESRNSSSETKWTSGLNQPGEEDLASSSIMFNKTWNIHKTTPFYNFSLLQYDTYEAELLAFIVANARNMSSSTLAQQTPSGVSTFITANRQFPGQIDGSGRSLMETLDDPGDITGIKFQNLNLYDTHMEDDGDSGQFSLMISISVKPKGKTREQLYFCAVILDQRGGHIDSSDSAFTHFNLILLKAPVLIGQLLIQWLERKFDCKICRLLLQSFELRRIVDSSMEVMYNHAQGQGERKARPIELHYVFPEGVSGLRSISVSLPTDEARQLLVSREEGSDSGFLDGVEAHCTNSMRIDFDRLNLTRAGCSSWYIASEGKVKIFPAISERHSLGAFVHKIGDCGT